MRTQFLRVVAMAAFAALALAACGSSNKASSSSTTAATGTSAPPASTATPGTTTAPSAPAAVAVASNAKIGKSILVDSKGMTLYVWDNDTMPGKANCTGACASAWPPLDVSGTPTYGAGLTASMFSTVTGPNGEKQLAVNGKPLYRWTNDTKPGDATGQGVNGFHVVASNGTKIAT
jgi:predicted lipoprotein with Yx(FWY)xxD motif